MDRSGIWRFFFILSGLFLMAGGPLHPAGTTAEMLGHQDWVLSHALLLAGFVALLIGLILFSRRRSLSDRTRWWLRLATIGTALQAIEMVFHTAASVDHAKLLAGEPTPVLTTHLWLAVVFYPVFGVTFIGLVLAGVRDHTLGSRWIGRLGILGALGHGLAAPLVVMLGIEEAEFLFALLVLCALWLLLAGFWPLHGDTADRITSVLGPA